MDQVITDANTPEEAIEMPESHMSGDSAQRINDYFLMELSFELFKMS